MSFLNDVLNIFIKYYPQLLTGVGNTVLIALTSTVAGLALGLLTGVVRTAPMSKNPILRALHTAPAPLRHPDRVDQHRRVHG